MRELRRRIRAVAIAWLLCQAASIAAFVPDQCCVAHAAEAAAKAQPPCHESAPAKDGEACPMHQGHKSHECCTMRNGCDGPGTHLLTLFAFIGEIEKPASTAVMLDSQATPAAVTPAILRQITVPDAPPPKA